MKVHIQSLSYRAYGEKGIYMKHICITYHMTRKNEVAETCITLPMEAQIAEDILEHQGDSQYVEQGSFTITNIKIILNNLAALQGYGNAMFCSAEERN